MNASKTIQIFVPDGNPSGIKIASITSEMPQVVFIPRANLKRANSRPEASRSGVYFLIGGSPRETKPILYVGQAEDCLKRIKTHDATKEFWTIALTATSRVNEFSNTEIRFLEWYCFVQAKKVDRYKLANEKPMTEPNTPEPVRADLLRYSETIATLVATLGYPIFAKSERLDQDQILICKSGDAKAEGIYTEEGLTVYKGSTCRSVLAKTAGPWIPKRRKSLLSSGVLRHQKGALVFGSDYTFDTPSAAAETILGRNANGWDVWKYSDGTTLNDALR